MPKCPPNECPDEVCPICDSTIGSALVEKKSKRPILDSLLAVKNAVTVRGVVQTVTITSGNAAMNSMIRNWAASIERASGDPLPYVAIPLDSIGFNGLEAAGGVNLYKDVRAHAAFSAGGSNYGDPVYGDLSAYKWRFAYELLLKGVPVLLSDPDVVFLRNPVPYFVSAAAYRLLPSLLFKAREPPPPAYFFWSRCFGVKLNISLCGRDRWTLELRNALTSQASRIPVHHWFIRRSWSLFPCAQATLPKCDIYMQMDVDWPSTGESIRQRVGWPACVVYVSVL